MTTHTQTLGELVTSHPAAASILFRHRLDFCCGGKRSVDEACAEAGIDAAALREEVAQAEAREGDGDLGRWDQRSLAELIDHIVATYHTSLRQELPELIAMADKVERVYQLHDACPTGLGAHLRGVHEAVLSHLMKEEEILFPAIVAGSGADCGGPVHCMEAEHEAHGENLGKTREMCNDFQAPDDACTTFRVLFQRLQTMEEELMKHIHLENNVLFPRALRGEH